MGFIIHFAILFFTSKICTVPLWFLCKFVFYTLQGFQGYLICNFWQSRLFYIDFTSSAQNLEFEIWIWTRIDWFDWGLTSLADVAASYRLVPFLLEVSKPSHQILIGGTGKKRCGGDSPARCFPTRCVLELVDGEVPVACDCGEVADGVRTRTVTSNSWSASTYASRGDVEERLEETAALGVVDKLEPLQFWTRKWHEQMRGGEGKRLRPEGGCGVSTVRRNLTSNLCSTADSGGWLRRPGEVLWAEKERIGRGGSWGLNGKGFKRRGHYWRE
jgi:hypothetical protein